MTEPVRRSWWGRGIGLVRRVADKGAQRNELTPAPAIQNVAESLAASRSWPLTTREAAARLIEDLSGAQGWEDPARQARYKR